MDPRTLGNQNKEKGKSKGQSKQQSSSPQFQGDLHEQLCIGFHALGRPTATWLERSIPLYAGKHMLNSMAERSLYQGCGDTPVWLLFQRPQQPHGGSQSYVTTVPGGSTPSSALHKHQDAHGAQAYLQTKYSHTLSK